LQPPDAAVPDERSELPRLGRLSVTDATVAYRDAAAGIATEGALDRLALEDRGERIALDGTGRVGDQPLRLAGSFGSFAQLADRGTPYPVDLSAELGGVRTALAGTVAEAAKLEGLDLAVRVEAGNLGPAMKAIGLPALPLPATTVAGRLGRSAGSWTLRDLDARSGDLAVTGELGVAIGGPRPKLVGRLRSERIDVAALRRQLAPASEASGTGEDVIPEGRLGLDRLRGIDADIGLAFGTLQAGPLRLAAVELRAVLDAGRLRLDPLGADFAGGRVGGTVAIDASRAPPAVTLDLNAGRLRLERLLAEAGLEGQGKGALSLRLKLAGTGRSPQALATSADGQLTVAMEEGEISMLLVEGLGIDPGDIVGVLLASSKADPLEERYPLACAVLDIDLRGGVATLRAAVIDTPDSVITAAGGADLARETLDLDLAAHPKDMSLFSARAPVHIGGRFGAVEVDADLTGIAARGAAAVALGVLLTPFAAILPFVDLGGAEDAPCGKLVGEAERRGNAPVQQPKR
ncbi:MAG: AsmA-like C-terminal region-containing protein, partial [Dongiaceae bacterium]